MGLCYLLLKTVSVAMALNYRITKTEQMAFSPLIMLAFCFFRVFCCCCYVF